MWYKENILVNIAVNLTDVTVQCGSFSKNSQLVTNSNEFTFAPFP